MDHLFALCGCLAAITFLWLAREMPEAFWPIFGWLVLKTVVEIEDGI